MKRCFCLILVFCLGLTSLSVFAKDEKPINVYTISYNPGTETAIADSTATGYSELIETSLSRVKPVREGYEFLGWSYSEKDYDNTPLMQPGEKIKISSSVELYAIWHDVNVVKISYLDGPISALPSQWANIGEVKISEMIPRKDGYVFAGWSYSGPDGAGILTPGSTINVEKNVVLTARWERGEFSQPDLQLRDSIPGAVFFGCDNSDQFGSMALKVRNLGTDAQNSYTLREGRVKVDDLPEGAYEAQLFAEKYGIEYYSKKINFVLSQGIEAADNPLTVYMDGKKLTFDLEPVLLDGHTFVTLRYFCEYLGANVLWENESRTAIITYNGIRMKIKENSDVCVVDGRTYQLPAPTVIMSSRMFIPLRSVAELCNCEVIWDPSRKVYMFSDKSNIFDRNIFTIKGNNGKFMCVEEGELSHTTDAEFGAMWIFDAVDADRGIYEIYNFTDMMKPLEMKSSEPIAETPLRLWEKSGFDGYLWKVTKCGDGEYFIQSANHEELYFDAANLCITTDATKVYLGEVYR